MLMIYFLCGVSYRGGVAAVVLSGIGNFLITFELVRKICFDCYLLVGIANHIYPPLFHI